MEINCAKGTVARERKREIAHLEAPRYVWLSVLDPCVIIVTSPRYIWVDLQPGRSVAKVPALWL